MNLTLKDCENKKIGLISKGYPQPFTHHEEDSSKEQRFYLMFKDDKLFALHLDGSVEYLDHWDLNDIKRHLPSAIESPYPFWGFVE